MKHCMKKCLGIGAIIAGLASAGLGPWLLLHPAMYQATARVLVKHTSNPNVFSDSYYIETEFPVIDSQFILGRVVEALNLDVEWGRKYAGGITLKTPETVHLLRERLDLHRVAMTEDRIGIGVKAEDPVEAAKIANAIAEAYRNYVSEDRGPARNYGNSVTVVGVALPPTSSIGPSPLLGAGLLLCGLAALVPGFYSISRGTPSAKSKP
jgi:uncharacterized protein involved in exopolysaccharide biosynthesis